MVQTRAATKRVESGQAPYVAAPVPSSSKRQAVDRAESPKKRRRGKERELCQLNLDVLFLLAGYLHPLDLLNLARTCKSLRELLMDKASTFVWKTARRQVEGLPDCPADLTEPEYANLLFYPRCYGCGKYAKKILWGLRRRYCPDCRQKRLCYFSSCPSFVLHNYILPMEAFTINGERADWVDKEQLDSVIREYDCSSDKEQWLKEKQEQRYAIIRHARECKDWEWRLASERRSDLDLRRQERYDSIFNRLKQHGYEREIAYFGHYQIRQNHKHFFRTSKPLTDKEWAQMWPKWLETMDNFKSERMERIVYRPRRDLLASEYASYLASPSSSTPVCGLLPHLSDVARLAPFRDVIYAPEGNQLGIPLFESALAQLPALADEWSKPLEIELANLVQISPHLSSKPASDDYTPSSSVSRTEPSQSVVDKLRLACAVFYTGSNVLCRYPLVLSSSMRRVRVSHGNDDSQRTFQDRFGIKLLQEAPYIVHACGLDPNVATVEDMDRRNARLKCLSCAQPWVRSWRNALFHACYCHQPGDSSRPASPACWELIGDEHIEAIQAVEQPIEELHSPWMRCLLCRPSVGDAMFHSEVNGHIVERHGIERDAIRLGEHYVRVAMDEPRVLAEMEEMDGQVVFKHIAY